MELLKDVIKLRKQTQKLEELLIIPINLINNSPPLPLGGGEFLHYIGMEVFNRPLFTMSALAFLLSALECLKDDPSNNRRTKRNTSSDSPSLPRVPGRPINDLVKRIMSTALGLRKDLTRIEAALRLRGKRLGRGYCRRFGSVNFGGL